MRRVRFTRRALLQLDEIIAYVEARNPEGASNVAIRLQALVEMLARHPLAGRETDRDGGRRLATTAYPSMIYYRLLGDEVVIQRIRHASRRPL